MARAKRKGPQGQLGDWADKVPEAVEMAAEDYDRAHTAKSKASEKLNTAKEVLIDAMRSNGVTRVRIRNGETLLVISATDKVTYEKPKEAPVPA